MIKRIAILLISALTFMPMMIVADESEPIVHVQKSENGYSIAAEGYGSGTTLEFAKFAAINSVLPQLVIMTNNMHGSVISTHGVDDKFSGKGADKITGETLIMGHWDLESGIYRYHIRMMIKNDNVKNDK